MIQSEQNVSFFESVVALLYIFNCTNSMG